MVQTVYMYETCCLLDPRWDGHPHWPAEWEQREWHHHNHGQTRECWEGKGAHWSHPEGIGMYSHPVPELRAFSVGASKPSLEVGVCW